MTLRTGDIAAAIGRIARTERAYRSAGLLHLLLRFLVGFSVLLMALSFIYPVPVASRRKDCSARAFPRRTVRAPGATIASSETPAQSAPPA
ncbi:hypothetical protein AWB69_06468 [Caballeronia udeis]|uniref:Uncharacterized protein n=1 Tax=Caballeronia udeis TaxID=1232866 RepID=A0A158IRD8_9BURK|nr:hypothetical protein AWB69_06468 [Caballeronia udeis]